MINKFKYINKFNKMELEELVVHLGTNRPGDNRELIKSIRDCRNKTFRKIISIMTDPEGDELNPPYEDDEKDLAATIRYWYEEHKKSEEGRASSIHINLMYKDKNNRTKEIDDLDKKVSDYNDIVKKIRKSGEFGEEMSYDGIELVADCINVGGY